MTMNYATEEGLATEKLIHYYLERAKGGVGLIIVEGTFFRTEGKGYRNQLGLFSKEHAKRLHRLTEMVHGLNNDVKIIIQIHHAGALAFKEVGGRRIAELATSLIRLSWQQFATSGLRRIRAAFRAAARRAVEAGFDIIEIHGAHGYLFSQFLSPLKNWRIDRYGGKIENRRRLLLEVYQDVHFEVAGKAMATARIGVADGHRGGLTLADGLSTAAALENEGARLLDISSGSGTPASVKPEGSPYSGRLHLARAAKQVVSIPIIGGGGIRHPDLAEKSLQDGMADLIYVGRGILADPGWARKTIEGKPESIVPCQECSTCFHHSDSDKCPARKKLSRAGFR